MWKDLVNISMHAVKTSHGTHRSTQGISVPPFSKWQAPSEGISPETLPRAHTQAVLEEKKVS